MDAVWNCSTLRYKAIAHCKVSVQLADVLWSVLVGADTFVLAVPQVVDGKKGGG